MLFQCSQKDCLRSETCKKDIVLHEFQTHFRCHFCQNDYDSLQDCHHHFARTHQSKLFWLQSKHLGYDENCNFKRERMLCNICSNSFEFTSPEQQKKHEILQHFFCSECDQKFLTEETCLLHFVDCHESTIMALDSFQECSFCFEFYLCSTKNHKKVCPVPSYSNYFAKPKRGKWIVLLERID